MPVEATGRKHISEVVANHIDLKGDRGAYMLATVDVKGGGDISPLGMVLQYDGTDAFRPYVVAADWAAATAYVVGDVVKPATRDGFEYVCVAAGTSGGAEPTFVTVEGATTTDNTATWIARAAYSASITGSPLPNEAGICIAVGTKEGYGLNKADVTLSATATKMTVLFRGDALVISEGLDFNSADAADIAEVKKQLEKQELAVVSQAEVVVPSFNP